MKQTDGLTVWGSHTWGDKWWSHQKLELKSYTFLFGIEEYWKTGKTQYSSCSKPYNKTPCNCPNMTDHQLKQCGSPLTQMAVLPNIRGRAFAVEISIKILTWTPILAWLSSTVIHICKEIIIHTMSHDIFNTDIDIIFIDIIRCSTPVELQMALLSSVTVWSIPETVKYIYSPKTRRKGGVV